MSCDADSVEPADLGAAVERAGYRVRPTRKVESGPVFLNGCMRTAAFTKYTSLAEDGP